MTPLPPAPTPPPFPGAGPATPGGGDPAGMQPAPWPKPVPAAAGPASQFAVFACCTLAIALVCTSAGATPYLVLGTAALAVGILLGLGTPAGRLAERVSGLAAAVVVAVAMIILLAVAGSQGIVLPPSTILLAALLALGLDWRRVDRLRALPLVAGVFVVFTVGGDQGWAYPAAVAWFAVAVGALWLLEADRRRALARPLAPPDGVLPPTPPRTSDLVRTLGLGLALGLAAAFVLGNPSCSSPDAPDLPGTPGGGRSPFPDWLPPDGRLGPDGQERTIDGNGNQTFTDPRTGETYTVREEGGRQIVRDSEGRRIGELEGDRVVSGSGGGDSQAYRVDEDGRVYTETEDGERLYVERSGDSTVLRDEDGNVVAEGDVDDDHLYVRTPDGDTLVPDPDGDGTIPVPPGAVTDGALGSEEGRTVERRGDRTIITDASGERRTYDTDPQGRPRVTVEPPGDGPARVYVFDERGGEPLVLEYDGDGHLVREYRYDPEGRIVEPGGTTTDSGSGSEAGGAGEGQVEPEPTPDERGPVPWAWILAGLVGLTAMVATGIWLSRRRRPTVDRSWAESQVHRVEQLGAAHQRPRRATESIVTYTRALADSVVPDERMAAVGEALSDALFGRQDIGTGRQAWVEATLGELGEAHPPPSWTDRFHRPDRSPAPTSA